MTELGNSLPPISGEPINNQQEFLSSSLAKVSSGVLICPPQSICTLNSSIIQSSLSPYKMLWIKLNLGLGSTLESMLVLILALC